MIFRVHHDKAGGHVHCSLFAGAHDGALGKCGDFVIRADEFEHFAWLTRSRFEFVPAIQFHERPSVAASGLANRILDQVRRRLTPDEFVKLFGVMTVALDDCFDLGIQSSGGSVIEDAPPRPYPTSKMPPVPPPPAKIACDWFTLPPKQRTKAILLKMLGGD